MQRFVLLALLAATAIAAKPAFLVITYQCAPQQRAGLRNSMVEMGLTRFQRWRDSGILQSYRILFSRYVNTEGWDMMVVLGFENYANVERWKDIEHRWPAGLTHDELSMTTSIRTDRMELLHEKLGDDPPSHPVFRVSWFSPAGPDDAPAGDRSAVMYQSFVARAGSKNALGLLIEEYDGEEALDIREKAAAQGSDENGNLPIIADELGSRF